MRCRDQCGSGPTGRRPTSARGRRRHRRRCHRRERPRGGRLGGCGDQGSPDEIRKIVVTDDQGRYLLPDLPKGNYDIWVRGYGLVDSPKVKSAPGKTLDLKAVAAPNRAAAAEYYPAQYWYSMVNVPPANLFPGTGPAGNGMTQVMTDQALWLRYLKTDGCVSCHQLGDKATRTIPQQLGHFDSGSAAWERRIQSGQASGNMVNAIGRFDTQRALAAFGDWTDRVA